MRIQSRMESLDRGKTAGLKKREHVEDIFNNRPGKAKDSHDAKLRLSHASQALMHDLHQDVKAFLGEHPEVAEKLSALPVDEVVERRHLHKIETRRVIDYLNWRKFQGDEVEFTEEEAAYHAVHALGKDEEMQAIHDRFHGKGKELVESKKKDTPNYYYLAFPETYAFN